MKARRRYGDAAYCLSVCAGSSDPFTGFCSCYYGNERQHLHH